MQTLKHIAPNLFQCQRTGTFYAIYRRQGKQIKRSLRTKELTEAVNAMQAVANGDTTSPSMTFGGACTKYLLGVQGFRSARTVDRRQQAIDQLLHLLPKDTPLAALNAERLMQWATERRAKVGPRTYNIERETLNCVLDHAVTLGALPKHCGRSLPRARQLTEAPELPPKEALPAVMAYLWEHSAEAWVLVGVLAYSGMRLGEALQLRWRDIDTEQRLVHVPSGKTGRRTIPLFPSLEYHLREVMTMRRTWAPDALVVKIATPKTALHSARRATGHYFHPHMLRHWFTTHAIEKGVDFRTIAGWLGHKDGGSLVAKLYGHLRDAHSRTMASRM